MNNQINNGIQRTKISRKIRDGKFKDSPASYSFENERIDVLSKIMGIAGSDKSLHQRADRLEEIRIFDFNALTPLEQLDHLKKEVKVRIGISKREIFIIGQILSLAKGICQQAGIKYMSWIEDNFDFSYETSRNFVHVYEQCFAKMEIAVELPTSILYKVSAPNFPEELREYLFDKGKLSEITNGSLKGLVEKYKEGGIEAVKEDIEKLTYSMRVDRQIKQDFDRYENLLRQVNEIQKNMENGTSRFSFSDFETEIDGFEPGAKKIERILYDAVERTYKDLERARREAIKVYHKEVKYS